MKTSEVTASLLSASELLKRYEKNGVIGDWMLSEFGEQMLREMAEKEKTSTPKPETKEQ